jgi:hypothetical protein
MNHLIFGYCWPYNLHLECVFYVHIKVELTMIGQFILQYKGTEMSLSIQL